MTTKLLLEACQGQRTARAPLWLMRQAGRYLPEYQAIRRQHNTLTMFQTPSIACEVTTQPIKRFGMDGAILYADILLIPEALGRGLSFVEGEGPVLAHPVRTAQDIQDMKALWADKESFRKRLAYVAQTLTLVKPALPPHVTLLGFAGAPLTVACYLIEGRGSHEDFALAKSFILAHPDLFHDLMGLLTDITIDYLHNQVSAGAEALQLFESWSGLLDPHLYREFCFPYVNKIIQALKKQVPVILFLGQGAGLTDQVLALNPSVYSVDWRQDLSRVAAQFFGSHIALQGNLDPALLLAPQPRLQQALETCLKVGQAYPHGYIFNLGHGVHRTTPPQNVGFLVDFVKKAVV